MKFWIFSLLAMTALAQQSGQPSQPKEPPKLARLEGTVVSLAGAPIPRAQVRLQSPTTIVNGTASPGGNYAVTTDDAGKFVIEGIEPSGNLRLSAQKTGYLTSQYGQRYANGPTTPLTLGVEESRKGLVLTMTPQGVVSGRVTDPNGDPVQGVQVQLQRRGYQRGVRALVSTGSVSTNDQGEYRIANVVAGRYYVQASPRNTEAILLAASSNGPPVENSPILTFYPNGVDQRSAAPLDVAAGQELRGIDIKLRQGRVYSASGKVISGGDPLTNPRIVVMPRTGAGAGIESLIQSLALSLQQIKTDGTFQLRNMTPGPYTLQVIMPVNGSTRSVGSLDFDITDKNLTDLVITTGAGATITGLVRLENGDLKDIIPPAPPNANQTRSALDIAIALNPAEAAAAGIAGSGTIRMAVSLQNVTPMPLAGSIQSAVESDGKFKLEGIGSGSYYLSAGAPSGTYVKAVRFNGADVTRSPLDMSRGSGGTIEILLAKNPAGVSGSVQNEKSEPMPSTIVSLWPQDPDQGNAAGGVRRSQTNASGTFQFQGLRPGIYYAAGFEAIDSELAQAREYLMLLIGDATKVEVKEGATPSLQLKLIPEAKLKAAEEKLP